jgi:hypothetical protein
MLYDIDTDIYFTFHKSKLASRLLDIEHVKYTDTTEQKNQQNTGRSNKVNHCHSQTNT